jgi:NAD(P)-dependent dehydrogenase (short-subunit alcohol dehydrogenase family)
MAKVLITGSADGLGLMVGRLLAEQGHGVVLHARSPARAADAQAALPQARAVLVGDLSTLAAMRDVAGQANGQGRFDAVIHNVALGFRESGRVQTADGLSQLWAVNVLAPYVLTALMMRPGRLVYLSSGMHARADTSLEDLQWTKRPWDGSEAYAETKFQDVLLAFGVARLWPEVLSNAMTPGWVATRMGGQGAPDDLGQAHLTQAWLAVSDDPAARVTGRYFYHRQARDANPAALDPARQDRLLAYCHALSGVGLAK